MYLPRRIVSGILFQRPSMQRVFARHNEHRYTSCPTSLLLLLLLLIGAGAQAAKTPAAIG